MKNRHHRSSQSPVKTVQKESKTLKSQFSKKHTRNVSIPDSSTYSHHRLLISDGPTTRSAYLVHEAVKPASKGKKIKKQNMKVNQNFKYDTESSMGKKHYKNRHSMEDIGSATKYEVICKRQKF